MALVKTLSVLLNANTKQFDSKLKKSAATTKSLATRIAAAGKSMAKGLLAGLAGVAAAVTATATLVAVKFKRMVQAEMVAIDRTAKLSRSLGLTTKELGILGHAADITGASLEAAGGGIKFMLRGVDDAASGIGTAKPFLEDLGFDPEKLKELSPADMFATLADAMNKIENPARRLNAHIGIFGRSGSELVNLTALGSEGLKEMGEQAERLGILVSGKGAAGVEAANDAILNLRKSIKGVAVQAAVDLAPFIQIFAEDITASILRTREEANEITAEFGGWGGAVIATAGAMQEVVKSALTLEATLLKMLRIAGVLADATSNFSFLIPEEQRNQFEGFMDDVEDRVKEVEKDLVALGQDDWAKRLTDRAREAKEALEFGSPEGIEEQITRDTNAWFDLIEDTFARRSEQAALDFPSPEFDLDNINDYIARLKGVKAELVAAGVGRDGSISNKRLEEAGVALSRKLDAAIEAARLGFGTDGATATGDVEGIDKTVADMNKRAEALASTFEAPGDAFQRKLTDAADLLEAGLIDRDLFGKAMASYQSELDKLNIDPAAKEMEERLKALSDSVKTPVDTLKEGIAEAAELFEKGFIDEELFTKLLANFDQEIKDLEGPAVPVTPVLAAEAVGRDTLAERSLINEARRLSEGTALDDGNKTEKASLAELKGIKTGVKRMREDIIDNALTAAPMGE